MKVVINKCYGGFGLSDAAFEILAKRLGTSVDAVQEMQWDSREGFRSNPEVVKVVEELGKESWGSFAELKVVEIPDGIDWLIDDYDGIESIHEAHREWF